MLRLLPTAFELLVALQTAPSAMVTGIVRDGTTQQPLIGATVLLVDLDRIATTDALGRYQLRGVPAGPQHLAVSVIGYTTHVLHALVPREGSLEINFSLKPHPVALRVLEVRAPLLLRGLESADPSSFADRSVSIAAVRNHPMLAEPDIFAALTGGDVTMRPESPSGLHVRGGSTDQVGFVIDGFPVLSPYHSLGVFSSVNPDAIARVELYSTAPAPAMPDLLAGSIVAQTRTHGRRVQTQGSVSTMQMRITADGPIAGEAGFLLSVRSGFPGSIVPSTEPSYVRGRSSDWLAKIEAPLLRGRLQLLGFRTEDDINAAARVDTARVSPRNSFDWDSHTFGASWTMTRGALRTTLRFWNAGNDVDALWRPESQSEFQLAAARNDVGLLASVDREAETALSSLGLRLTRTRTTYSVTSETAIDSGFDRVGILTSVVPFVQHVHRFGSAVQVDAGTSLMLTPGRAHVSPRVQLLWTPSETWRFTAAYARLHQFVQSLRNPESLVGTIFPVDLFLAAGDSGTSVARGTQLTISGGFSSSGLRVMLTGYRRNADGLTLVAPSESEPFASRSFTSGTSHARGVSLEAGFSAARYGIVGSYGWQDISVMSAFPHYVPEHGATHSVETGVIVFPTPTFSIRAGVNASAGRRSTLLSGPLEWEACNLLDEGCEFGGSPRYGSQPLGGMTLPAYLRADVGFRKHWHFGFGSRDGLIALYGTVTNIFGRRNLLAYSVDPMTGHRSGIEMRPIAPLVAGIDWRF